MKQVLAHIGRLFTRRRTIGEDTRRLPSLIRAIKRLAPSSVVKEVVASSHDRRQWGVLAAAWVGVSEREFMHAAAHELGMPYQDHVTVPDLTVFGKEARSIMSSLRRAGATVQIQENKIVGFVATDPAEIRGLELFDGTQSICMAPWTEVAKSLEMSERQIAECEANSDRAEALRRRDLCEKVLEIIIHEAVQHGAGSVDILSLDGKNRYQFSTPCGKVAVGVIQTEAFLHLMAHLNEFEEETFSHPNAGEVLVRALGSSSNLRLSWGHNNRSARGFKHDISRTSFDLLPKTTVEIEKKREISQQMAPDETIPVLVVDDNPMFCRMLERLLKREQCNVSCVGDGVEALKKLNASLAFLPKVIICDLHMPTMDGRDFVRKLKEDPRLRGIPIVMLTSDDGVEAELSVLELGVEAQVSKARDPRVLCAQVLRLSRMSALQEAA